MLEKNCVIHRFICGINNLEMFISQVRLDTDMVAQAAEVADAVMKEFQLGTARCYPQRTRICTNIHSSDYATKTGHNFSKAKEC